MKSVLALLIFAVPFGFCTLELHGNFRGNTLQSRVQLVEHSSIRDEEIGFLRAIRRATLQKESTKGRSKSSKASRKSSTSSTSTMTPFDNGNECFGDAPLCEQSLCINSISRCIIDAWCCVDTHKICEEGYICDPLSGNCTLTCHEGNCFNGQCVEGSCQCNDGVTGIFCDEDIDECTEGSSDCAPASEICVNRFGSYTCDCADDLWMKNDAGVCEDMSQELTVASAVYAGTEYGYMDLFDTEFLLRVSQGISVVPGSVSLSNTVPGLENTPPIFRIQGGVNQELIIQGNYQPLPGDTIPNNIKAKVYFQDGRNATASVNQATGFFSLAIFDIPYGIVPFILLFLTETSDEPTRLQRSLIWAEEEGITLIQKSPRNTDEQELSLEALTSNSLSQIDSTAVIGLAENMNLCGPAFSLTLTWDGPTSDVDLHVFEPGGKEVCFWSKQGANGAYLDFDDTWGYGPEHYFAPTEVFVGSAYTVQVRMYSYNQDTNVDVNWNLAASSYGRHLWSESGTFHYGITPYLFSRSWTFVDEPVCETNPCLQCGVLSRNTRRLAQSDQKCADVKAPDTYQSVYTLTDQWSIDQFYCNWEHYSVDPLVCADLLNQGALCVTSMLDPAQRQDIISRLGDSLDAATAVKAGLEVNQVLEPGRNSGDYACRHHAVALSELLHDMGYEASVKTAWSWTNSANTWVEATISGQRYVLDCFQGVYFKVNALGPGCIYSSSEKKVGCTNDLSAVPHEFLFVCTTTDPSWSLPKGEYYVGKATSDQGSRWFNLYKTREKGGIWDYSTKIPTESCRSGFGFHQGSALDGCISVEDIECFTKVETFLESFSYGLNPARPRYQCDGCVSGLCVQGEGESEIEPIALYSHQSTARRSLFLFPVTFAPYIKVISKDDPLYSSIPGSKCFHSIDGMTKAMLDLEKSYPDLVSVIPIGKSYLNETMYAMKITAKGIPSASKGVVLLTAGVHAKEYAPPELLMRFATKLLEKYGKDADVTWILQRTEIHSIFYVNPDGRRKAEDPDTDWWRKNVHRGSESCSSGTYGVDINRNFPFMWGTENDSTSKEPCRDDFMGTSAESEPETKAVTGYAKTLFPASQRKDDPVAEKNEEFGEGITGLYIDIHSYGGWTYFPWGHDMVNKCPDNDSLEALARKISSFNEYALWGPGQPQPPDKEDPYYATYGDSADYMYGMLGVAALGLELGKAFHESCDIFENEIVPRNLPALIYAAKLAKKPFSLGKGPDILKLEISIILSTGESKVTASASDSQLVDIQGYDPFLTGRQSVTDIALSLDVYPDDAQGDLMHMTKNGDNYEAIIHTESMSPGKHILYAQAMDSDGYLGPVSSIFIVGEGSCPTTVCQTRPTLMESPTYKASVENLQCLLNKENNARLTVDGYFGPLTSAAVKDWQVKKDLVKDGIVGCKTWETLCGLASTPPCDKRACKYEVTAGRTGLETLLRNLSTSVRVTGNSITWTDDATLRWSGISSWTCPVNNKVPTYADASSFISWVYWTAYGLGEDKLNGHNWEAGDTGTMATRGIQVSKSLIVNGVKEHASLDNVQPGDLVFYGSPVAHVAIYIGNGKVASMLPDGGPLISDVVFPNVIVEQVRSYIGTKANQF